MIVRDMVIGTVFVGKLFPGESMAVMPSGDFLITHPERRPQLVPVGETRVLDPTEREAGVMSGAQREPDARHRRPQLRVR